MADKQGQGISQRTNKGQRPQRYEDAAPIQQRRRQRNATTAPEDNYQIEDEVATSESGTSKAHPKPASNSTSKSSQKVLLLKAKLAHQEEMARIASEKRRQAIRLEELEEKEKLADTRFLLKEAELESLGSDESDRRSPVQLRTRSDTQDKVNSYLKDCKQYSHTSQTQANHKSRPQPSTNYHNYDGDESSDSEYEEFFNNKAEQQRIQNKADLDEQLAHAKAREDLDKRIAVIKEQMDRLETEKRESQRVKKPPESQPPVIQQQSGNPPDQMQQMIQAITSAFQNVTGNSAGSSSTTTEKFLARQSHGKDLPHFYGRPEEWITFKMSYENTSAACQYNNCDNLTRLQKCLKGEAMQLVQSLMGTPDNVPTILKKLELRFGQPRHIVETLTKRIADLPPVKEDKPESLIQLGIAVETLTSTIQALKLTEHLNNPSLLQQVENKLPFNYKLQWGQWTDSDTSRKWDLENFGVWIGRLTETACKLCPPTPKEDFKRKPPDAAPNRRKPERVCAIDDEKPHKENAPKDEKARACILCKDPKHKIQQCKKYKEQSPIKRNDFAKEKRLCFGCLNYGHMTKDCHSKKTCGEDGCTRKHHPLVHTPVPQKKVENPKVPKEETESSTADVDNSKQMNHTQHSENEDLVIYQVLPVTLRGPRGEMKVDAIFDNCSAYTLIEENVAKHLGLKGKFKPLIFKTIGHKSTQVDSDVVKLDIINPKSGKSYQMKNVQTFNGIDLPARLLEHQQISQWDHLRDFDLSSYKNSKPKILIGIPHARLMAPISLKKSPPEAPIAIETRLGWTLFGTIPNGTDIHHMNFINHMGSDSSENEDDQLHELVHHHFSTEAFGVRMDVKAISPEDKRAIQLMDSNLRKVDGKYETGLLWARDDIMLPESRHQAMTRLLSLERKLDGNPELAEKYCKKMDHYFKSGYTRKLSTEELEFHGPRVWYLPHFPVFNPKKPNKMRMVFDAAAIANNTSLNNNLLKGPDMLNPLPAVLFKFRQKAIAMSGDIREMFHQVKMKKEDQHSQRFLWRGMQRDIDPEEYAMSVMTFGATCSPYCAQEVKNRNAKEFATEYPEAYEAITKRHYVDDYLDSCDSVEEAYQLFQDVVEVHRRGGYEIVNWISNSRDLINLIPQEMRSDSQKDLDAVKNNTLWTERVLGMIWDPEPDIFTFTTNFVGIDPGILSGVIVPTKRQALSLIMSIFDPMGFVANLTIKAKILLQDTWREKLGWNDKLKSETFKKWTAWLQELKGIKTCRIPRCYSSIFSQADEIQLHVFCDASSQAMSAVAYFRMQKNEEVIVKLVSAKSKVKPLDENMTIPKAELQAAVIGARLSTTIIESHEIKPHRVVYWTDSQIVLRWLHFGESKLKVYEANRIGELQTTTDINSWRHVPSQDNVADDATRDNKPCDFGPKSRWLNGPEFLLKDEAQWPKLEIQKQEIIASISVAKKEPLIKIERFSNWMRLLRTTAYCIKLCSNKLEGGISPQDLDKAERQWWKWSQDETFAEEIKFLKNNKPLPKGHYLLKYSPFIDEHGILRMKGRVQGDTDLGDMDKNPVILGAKHPYTVLMISYFHQKAGHHGQEKVVNDLRRKFCIPSLRVAVRRSWNNCQLCKNRRALPAVPEMAPLPHVRVEKVSSPFTYTGLDYFGPMEVKIGRRREKRYGALFTCLSSRAVHIEIAASLSTDSCIMAIRRFMARRGTPEQIWSDNGTNFIGANNKLRKALQEIDQKLIQDAMTTKGVSWKFIPPSAPHFGGSWERMVRSVKVALAATLHERAPTEEVLQTLMTETENIVNGRPLTYVADDPDSPIALTPNHILIGKGNSIQVPGKFDDADLILRKQWRNAQRLTEIFWKRWMSEYLPTLTKREKWQDNPKSIKIGDVVLILDQNVPRNTWKMGKVVKIYPSGDGNIRVVDIKTETGELRRPVAKLCVLDVQDKIKPEKGEEEKAEREVETGHVNMIAVKTKKRRWIIRPGESTSTAIKKPCSEDSRFV